MRPVLVDFACACDAHTNQAIEHVYKALGDDPGDSAWSEHESPYIRRIIELFTQRGLRRISGVDAELRKWLAGGEYKASQARRPRPRNLMAQWSPAELGATRLYLQSLPPDQFSLDDWMLLVDYLVQRYMPADDMRTEAEWLSTRANLMGRVQSVMASPPTAKQADKIAAALPASPAAAVKQFGLNDLQRAILEYGNAHCAESVVDMTDTVRHKLRRAIMDHTRARMEGSPSGALETRLVDEFAAMNRDWRRIAVTEAGENANQGLIATLKPGTRVQRVEKYKGACPFCQAINGQVMTVVAPDAKKKNGAKEIWVGKSNIGRAAAPRKREGGVLVDRQPDEMWWTPAGLVHPHCRGTWVVLGDDRRVDTKTRDWVEGLGK